MHREWVQTVFAPYLPAAEAAREARVDLLVVATDVYTWKQLRRDRGLDRGTTDPADRTSSWPRSSPQRVTDMADILFVTWDGGGNVPPAVGIAEELKARGHRVRFLGHPRQAPAFAERGLEFSGFPTARPFDSTVPATPLKVLATFGDRAMGADVVAELAARPADVVVVDCLLFSVMDALRTAGRSYVALEHSFDTCWRGMAKGPFGLLLRLRGMKALALLDGGEPTMAATIPDLDTGHGDVVHTGTGRERRPGHAVASRPCWSA